jgi:hypothetical protein
MTSNSTADRTSEETTPPADRGAFGPTIGKRQTGAFWGAVGPYLAGEAFPGRDHLTCLVSRWFFLRAVGVIYFIAFVSFWIQLKGLIGPNGITPAVDILEMAQERLGVERYWMVPTLCWVSGDDFLLDFLCGAGTALSLALMTDVAPAICLFLLYTFYLSLVSITPVFLGFQWDSLLLETTFLAIFLAPWKLAPGPSRDASHPWVMVWLVRLLLFRLMFSSGIVKLSDETWRNLTALTFHYETQPLPHMGGWLFHQLPVWFHKLSALIMFAIELVVPVFYFFPRTIRLAAAFATLSLQLLIMGTGNYTYFNLLTIALCLLLVDDGWWRRIVPERLIRWVRAPALRKPARTPQWAATCAVAFLVVPLSFYVTVTRAPGFPNGLSILAEPYRLVAPFHLVNPYGLFAHMTTSRPEIIIQGTEDGVNWKTYEFPWKPGDLKRRPGWVQPHQPRLDWQLWFAALSPQPPRWFVNFLVRLLEGSPDVLALVKDNPFADTPPKSVRALRYDYRFTDWKTFRETGAWWQREGPEIFVSPIGM